jgi:tRNA(Leu) C34 or U34 (ribose-2'-O)-methylase TrmL
VIRPSSLINSGKTMATSTDTHGARNSRVRMHARNHVRTAHAHEHAHARKCATHVHAHTRTRTHARTHTHTHAHARTHTVSSHKYVTLLFGSISAGQPKHGSTRSSPPPPSQLARRGPLRL